MNEVPSKIVMEDGKPKLQFTPTQPGLHTAEVVTPDQNKETPFDVSAPQVETGKPALIPISKALVEQPKDLSVVVKDSNGNEIPASISTGEGDPKVSFVPKSPGDLVAEIYSGPELLASIPIEATQPATVGNNTAIPFDTSRNPRNLQPIVTDPEGNILPATLTSDGGKKKVNFVPTQPGTHQVSVIDPSTGNKILNATAVAKPPQGPTEKPVSVPLPPTKLPKNAKPIVKDFDGNELPAKLEVNESGAPVVSFTPKVPGTHSLVVQTGPEKLVEIPFVATEDVPVAKDVSIPIPSSAAKSKPVVIGPDQKEVPSEVIVKNGNQVSILFPNKLKIIVWGKFLDENS
eukprot:TRINITY_DN3341_c0_g1_i1.p1 TRINITY_DN3341_c0_g1~~TRINITY_DN3341_c0_g1_i1.p1  ORF type:complete len:346 (-),score=135.22 TRINITY_DN3341_c0_g1_i1:61-1098(-)